VKHCEECAKLNIKLGLMQQHIEKLAEAYLAVKQQRDNLVANNQLQFLDHAACECCSKEN